MPSEHVSSWPPPCTAHLSINAQVALQRQREALRSRPLRDTPLRVQALRWEEAIETEDQDA
jgi:hypothetical protein